MLSGNKSITSLLKELKEHKLLHQTNINEENICMPASFYYGIDPNANFIHIGHISNILAIKIIHKYIPQFILLMGTFTCRVGDPTARQEARDMNVVRNSDHVSNTDSIKSIIINILDNLKINYVAVENNDWYKNLELSDYMYLTSFFNIKSIYTSEIFQNRLLANKPIYLHEFLYPTLQAYDYLHLYRSRQCKLQIGGQDQWTNILAGGQIIRQLHSDSAYAITTPLLVDENNNKIGKSTKNAINISYADNIFFTFNGLLDTTNYIQSQIAIMAGISFDTYFDFAKYIISLIYNPEVGDWLKLYYTQEATSKTAELNTTQLQGKPNIIIPSCIAKYIPTIEFNMISINTICKMCIAGLNNKIINLYIEKGFIKLNQQTLNCRDIKNMVLEGVNHLRIKNYLLIFIIKNKDKLLA